MEESHASRALSAVTAAFRNDQAHPYEGADPENAVRLVALLSALTGLLTLAFLPFEPPATAAGWVLAAAIGLGGIGGAVYLLRRSPPVGFDGLLALSYAGLAQVALLVWLGDGAGSAYQMLFLLWVGSAMGVHPPRRALVFLAATACAAGAPLLYDGWSDAAAVDIATSLLLWAVLGTLVLTLMVTVRRQRVTLRADEARERGLARADALTGLGNRRAFDEALEHELARCTRADSTASVILIDLDELKAINDEWGHVEGDRCLVQVGRAIMKAVRAGDRSFRWGGDEFAVLLPDTDRSGAEAAAESISFTVRRTCVDGAGLPLSVSVGLAEVDPGMRPEELVARADMALMARKRAKAANTVSISAGTVSQVGADEPHSW